jgi:hypothetical protein
MSTFSQAFKFWYDSSGNRTSRKNNVEVKSESGVPNDEKSQ